jgi:transposase
MQEYLRCGSAPQKIVFRMRIVLAAAEGRSNNEVAKKLETTRPTVLKWRGRYQDQGLDGILEDAAGRGRKKSITPEQEAEIVRATLETKPKSATQWSTRTMAAAQGVSDTTVLRIWQKHRLQPHRVKRFKLSTDPQLAQKVRDIVGLYLYPPDRALVMSVDEKSQIQALDRTQPILPLRPGLPERQTHDYQRHGTTTLFAALNVLDGTVIGHCAPRHRHQEFLRFLNKIDGLVPVGQQVHLILDNYGTHKHPKVNQWFADHPRYHLHFTPTGASWVNLVERFFAEITGRRIRRGTFRSARELVRAILDYIRERNKHPKPFVWTAKATNILHKVRRCLLISEAGH